MSGTVKIYRCEMADGKGLYASEAAYKVFSSDYAHPGPRDDALLKHLFDGKRSHLDYFYGWKSVEQCREWLYEDDWLRELHELGIVLAVYICPSTAVIHGTKQSVFCEHVSKTQHNIISYFRLNLDNLESSLACTK